MGTHPIFESDFDCLTEMGKKGKGKGKKGNEKHDYINARISMREKALIGAEAEAAEFERELGEMRKTLDRMEKEKSDSVRLLLKKLQKSDFDRAETVSEMNASIKQRHRELDSANQKRLMDEADKREQLRKAQENNHKLELEIEKWEKYGEVGCKEHDLVIQNLERTIQTQVDNTLNMQKFIIKQIETAKSDSEEVIRQQEATRRERAMMDAVNALPGSLHEVRKSDQLQKLVEWQGSAVSEDRQNVNQLRQQTKQLVKEAAILRQSQFKAPNKSRQTLDWNDLNGSSTNFALSENSHSTMDENRQISEFARANPLHKKTHQPTPIR